ncbi:MAG: hypothetical protein Q8R08_03550 [bacterium]|nr:hypothetical protein [bacterium]
MNREAYRRLLEIKREWDRLRANPREMQEFLLEQHIDDCPCDGCGFFVPPECKFCGNCGTQNPGFQPAAFEAVFEDSVEAVMRDDCSKPNGHEMDPDSETKFCVVCGTHVYPRKE